MSQPITAQNPHVTGLRIVDRDDFFPVRFSADDLNQVYASLMETRHDYGMLMESASFDEVDSFYNPGLEDVADSFIFEAITVDRFARTEKRMAAVVRVLKKHLMGEISALPPIVGKPKKSGSFAYVTVQLPFSDGQTVSVIFHSPEGDKKKITANDAIIAFRWLLNKRDITHLVAPEEGAEVSLETIATRLSQLVTKNSARFVATQKDAVAEAQALQALTDGVADLEEKNITMSKQIEEAGTTHETLTAKLANAVALLEKQKAHNAELEAILAGLRAAQPQGDADTGGTVPKADETEPAGQDEGKPAPSPVAPEDKILPPIEVDHAYQTQLIGNIEPLYAKAKAEGLNPISPEQFMADVETGNRRGRSMEDIKEDLRGYTNKLVGVRAGHIPSRQVGRGGKKIVIESLEALIKEHNHAIATNGIGNTSNLQNYHAYLRDLVRTKKDIGYTSNEELERKKQENIEQNKIYEAEYKELKEKAEQYKRYTVGTRDGIRRLLEVKFTLSAPAPDLLVDLGEAPSISDKYDFLRNKTDYRGVKREKMQFNREVELNSAMRNRESFKFFELSPRKGYSVATFGVDLDVKEERAKDPAVERFNTMVHEALRWRGAARVRSEELLATGEKKLVLALSRLTTKGDLDSYLMKKFSIDDITARNVSNHLTSQSLADDMTVNLADFADEPWYQATIQKAEEEKPKEGQSMSPHVTTLQEIVAGKHDTVAVDVVGTMLDTAYDELEKEGITPEIEVLLNQAADRLTELLKEVARKVA